MIILAANGNNELSKFVTAVGTLSGKVKITFVPTKRHISTERCV